MSLVVATEQLLIDAAAPLRLDAIVQRLAADGVAVPRHELYALLKREPRFVHIGTDRWAVRLQLDARGLADVVVALLIAAGSPLDAATLLERLPRDVAAAQADLTVRTAMARLAADPRLAVGADGRWQLTEPAAALPDWLVRLSPQHRNAAAQDGCIDSALMGRIERARVGRMRVGARLLIIDESGTPVAQAFVWRVVAGTAPLVRVVWRRGGLVELAVRWRASARRPAPAVRRFGSAPAPVPGVLPRRWATLGAALAAARNLGDGPFSDDAFPGADEPRADALSALLSLRLLTRDADRRLIPAAHLAGTDRAVLRVCALGLLVWHHGAPTMPARHVLRHWPDASGAPVAGFAGLADDDALLLARWYAEAGLIHLDGARWFPTATALLPLAEADHASQLADRLLAALLADVRQLHQDAPLPAVADLSARLSELGTELLIDPHTIRRIYRSLLAGRHVMLFGPPGTGKTELARRLPAVLWRAPSPHGRPGCEPGGPLLVDDGTMIEGYATLVTTATDEWGVRDVIGGIAPALDGPHGQVRYAISFGALTRAILYHYQDTADGRRLPADGRFVRRAVQIDGQARCGVWLVIDEVSRAPIDAALGGVLTTLGGGDVALLDVPAPDGSTVAVPLPRDFRIIGTLNRVDRHFVNQLSEALKRRFDFIEVLPPPRALAEAEQGIAAAAALRRLIAAGWDVLQDVGGVLLWPTVLRVMPVDDGIARYRLELLDAAAAAAVSSAWRIMTLVRRFRPLGTAQLVALYLDLFGGVRVELDWREALDGALADSLADQLQILGTSALQCLIAFVDHAGDAVVLYERWDGLVASLPPARQAALRVALMLDAWPDAALVGEPLALPDDGWFRRRLCAFDDDHIA